MPRFTFKLPDIGEGTAEAEIAAWRVAVGDHVEEDGPLVDMMTDKATVELTSPVSGTVLELGGEAGAMVPVGSALVVLETSVAEDIAATPAPQADGPAIVEAAATPHQIGPGHGTIVAGERGPHPASAPHPAVPLPTVPLPTVPPPSAPPPAVPLRPDAEPGVPFPLKPTAPAALVLAAPAVRARARALGVDLAHVQPGPHNRVRHAELDQYMAYQSSPVARERGTMSEAYGGGGQSVAPSPLAERTGVTPVKIIGLRRRIAEKMQEAKRRIPHFAYVEEVDVTELEALRQHLNVAHGATRGKLTLLPLLIRALTRTLPAFPQVNARFDDDAGTVERHAAVHLGIATQTPNGLVVPVIFHAEARSLWDLAAEITRLSTAAKAGKAASKDLSGSTITVTSLGALGGIVTTPVINHPEVAIVGVNKMVERPVVVGGQIVVRRMMNLSSSFDHRVVDGYDAAAFIQSVKAMLEYPATLFLDE